MKKSSQATENPVSTSLFAQALAVVHESVTSHSPTSTVPIMNGGGSHSAPPSRRSSLVMPSPTTPTFQANVAPLVPPYVDQSIPAVLAESQQFYQTLLVQQQYHSEQYQKLSEFTQAMKRHQHQQLVNSQQSRPMTRHASLDHGIHASAMQASTFGNQQILASSNNQPLTFNGSSQFQSQSIYNMPFQQYAAQPVRPRANVSRPTRFAQIAPSTALPQLRNSMAIPTHSSPPQVRPPMTLSRINSSTSAGVTSASPSSSLPNSPLVPSAESQALIDRAEPSVQIILRANNNRLGELARHLTDMAMYGPACDELNTWCRDERAYNPGNMEMIYNCMKCLRKYAPRYGLWSGVKVLKVVAGFVARFSSEQQEHLSRWLTELEDKMKVGAGAQAQVQVGDKRNRGGRSVDGRSRNGSIDLGVSAVATPPAAGTTSFLPSPSNSPNLTLYGLTGLGSSSNASSPVPTIDNITQQRPPQSQMHKFSIHPGSLATQGRINIGMHSRSPISQQTSSTLSTVTVNRIHNRISGQSQLLPPPPPPPPSKEPIITPSSPNYTRLHSYLLRPFKLMHKMPTTVQNFWVPPNLFQRVWMGDGRKQEVKADACEDDLPVTIQLNAWKPVKEEYSGPEEEGKTEWPPEGVHVYVNNTPVKLNRKTKQHLPNRPQGTYIIIGRDRPLDLAPFLLEGQNQIKLVQATCGCSVIYSVQLLLRESEEFIVRCVRERMVALEEGINLVNHLLGKNGRLSEPPRTPPSLCPPKLASTASDFGLRSIPVLPPSIPYIEDDDIEIIQTSVKVSLRDPIGMLRIAEPVKSIDCRHVDCFDLLTFLVTNRDNAHWKCPHCNKSLTSDKLYRDQFFEKLLAEVPQNVRTIELAEGGIWTAVNVDVDSDVDSEDEGDCEVALMRNRRIKDGHDISVLDGANGSAPSTVIAKKNVEVVSLLSDDEDNANLNQTMQGPVAGDKRRRSLMEIDIDLYRSVDGSARDERKSPGVQRLRREEDMVYLENISNTTPPQPKTFLSAAIPDMYSSSGIRVSSQQQPDQRNLLQMGKGIAPEYQRQNSPVLTHRHRSQSEVLVPETPTTELTHEMSFRLAVNPTDVSLQRATEVPKLTTERELESMNGVQLTKKVNEDDDTRFPDGNETRGPTQEPTPPSSSSIKTISPQQRQNNQDESLVVAVEDDLEEIEEEEEVVAVGNVTGGRTVPTTSTPGTMVVGGLRLNVPRGGEAVAQWRQ